MNEIPRPPRENAAEGEDRLKETAAMDEQPAQFDAETEAVEAAAEEIAERTPEEEAKHWHEQYLRTLADADNYRKRTERDRVQVRRYAIEDLLRTLLPFLDSLEMAAEAEGGADEIRAGVRLALAEAIRLLREKGLAAIESVDAQFDPRVHEAVGMRPDPERPAGTVLEEVRRGYMLHDRVLRASRVHISIEPPPPPAAKEDPEEAVDEAGEG